MLISIWDAALRQGGIFCVGSLLSSDVITSPAGNRITSLGNPYNIARQFSSLTRVNEENGELEATLHHWQQISLYCGVLPAPRTFSSWPRVEMEDVTASLTCVSIRFRFASHIKKIDSLPRGTLDIHLSQPIAGCRGWASPGDDFAAEWETLANFASHPIGNCLMLRRNTNQLKIISPLMITSAIGALIDEVNVWVLPISVKNRPAA
ncbi:hypothetical protein KCP71_01225 [Salmonella enterica subsp. enterica]|nr:hypothetical protein KCP71_01225 [Salmonella enterica subsp. enterica]